MPGSSNGHNGQNSPQQDLAAYRANDVAQQFPGMLDSEELEQVTQRARRILRSVEELRKYPLHNGDEPSLAFRPVSKEQP